MSEKKEYIERGASLEVLKEVVYSELASDPDNNRANYIIGAIELLPSADVEPVVRCRDCERWHPTASDTPNERFCAFMGKYTKASCYCGNAMAHMEMPTKEDASEPICVRLADQQHQHSGHVGGD